SLQNTRYLFAFRIIFKGKSYTLGTVFAVHAGNVERKSRILDQLREIPVVDRIRCLENRRDSPFVFRCRARAKVGHFEPATIVALGREEIPVTTPDRDFFILTPIRHRSEEMPSAGHALQMILKIHDGLRLTRRRTAKLFFTKLGLAVSCPVLPACPGIRR